MFLLSVLATLSLRDALPSWELPCIESARAFVVESALAGDSALVRGVIALVDERRGRDSAQWLSAYERLAIAVILPATDMLADSVAMARLLAAESAAPNANPFADDHAARLREHLIAGATRIAARYDDHQPSEQARRFFNLLLNHLHLRGLRGRSELGARAEAFVADHPDAWRSRLLERHVVGDYREDRFGLAFAAGYRTANVHGNAGELFEYAHGAALSGEAYLDRITAVIELNVGVAHAPSAFTAGGDDWDKGDLPYLAGSIGAGYELRLNRLAVTPLVGVSLHSLREEPGDSLGQARTGFRGGFDAAAIIGYRIPFDVGTHIDLRMRVGIATMAMSGYDSRLAGMLVYAQFGFALVHRPYRPRGV
jgi:hypothetical protein